MMMMRRRTASKFQKVALFSDYFISDTAIIESDIIPLPICIV